MVHALTPSLPPFPACAPPFASLSFFLLLPPLTSALLPVPSLLSSKAWHPGFGLGKEEDQQPQRPQSVQNRIRVLRKREESAMMKPVHSAAVLKV